MIPFNDRKLVAKIINVIVPDDQPSAEQDEVMRWLDSLAQTSHAPLWRDILSPGFASLANEPRAPDAALVHELEQKRTRPGWNVSPSRFIETLTRLTAHGWYRQPNSKAWTALGYTPGPKQPPSPPCRHVVLKQSRLSNSSATYDVIVVGAGLGGGVAARVLSSAGATVLLLERGQFLPYSSVGDDHVANQAFPLYGHNTGPDAADGGPRVIVQPGEPAHVVRQPFARKWNNNAMTVGGGSRVYQGIAWRFHPDDFRMATKYGIPEDSSLADWPLTYDELEPYYSRAEHELGVSGDDHAHLNVGFRSTKYPMPPLPANLEADVLRRGADKLGWTTGPVPLLLNSLPHGGRSACVGCGECAGFACPVDAKNGTHNTTIPIALETGRCTLATNTRAERVLVDTTGRTTGVLVSDTDTGERREIYARSVVLSAGAIETARLLLASANDTFPSGLGNATGQVGRHLQGHIYVNAFGIFDTKVQDGQGPGTSIATLDFAHNPVGDVVGGGVLSNATVKLPVMFWELALAPDARRWGTAGKEAMANSYAYTSHVLGPVQEIPTPSCRVRLFTGITDRRGVPVPELRGRVHRESVKAGHSLKRRAEEWLAAAGATRVWSLPVETGLSAGQHQAGTARMGTDPATSVTDPYGRVHNHPGLWVMDASLHVTNGGVNPALTVLALAYRCAEKFTQTDGL
ncbi:GMC family oxidoreductase [Phytoactinopolyspora limicola]|uniref:GMC family oxidoreductase n=1 Tax=Phytoactinopolyspora limicola TaxID=2715536 RepID=UPI00140B301E|nr:GMC family oxidoreductase [Phytoactinopolyspora limicola]